MILFIDACVRQNSRTRRLANALLSALGGEAEQLRLENVSFETVNEAFLNKRDALIAAKAFDDGMFALARQFAAADTIVIAAPHWDLSFPAALKQYVEQINVRGITFEYTPEGVPVGLCKARKLYYVTTAGGNFVPQDFGYGYIKALAESFYGIKDVELISAAGLDIWGADAEAIVEERIRQLAL